MNQQTARERMNALIVELDKYQKLSVRKQKEGRNKLQERIDRELQDCTPALLTLPTLEFKYLLDQVIRRLKDIGIVIVIAFRCIH